MDMCMHAKLWSLYGEGRGKDRDEFCVHCTIKNGTQFARMTIDYINSDIYNCINTAFTAL